MKIHTQFYLFIHAILHHLNVPVSHSSIENEPHMLSFFFFGYYLS